MVHQGQMIGVCTLRYLRPMLFKTPSLAAGFARKHRILPVLTPIAFFRPTARGGCYRWLPAGGGPRPPPPTATGSDDEPSTFRENGWSRRLKLSSSLNVSPRRPPAFIRVGADWCSKLVGGVHIQSSLMLGSVERRVAIHPLDNCFGGWSRTNYIGQHVRLGWER